MTERRMTARKTHLDLLAVSMLVVLCASWGLQQVSIKVANSGISPVLQAGLRSAVAAVLVLLWSRVRGIRLFERDGSLWLGLFIAALFGIEFVFLYSGLQFTTASRGILFLFTAPFFVAAGAHFLLPGERLHSVKFLGLLAAFAGVALAFWQGLALPTHRELVGDGMILLAGALWGATIVVIKATRLVNLSPHKTLLYQLAGSAVMLLPLSPLLGEPGITNPSALIWLCVAYQAVWVAFITYVAWFWLITRYPASSLSAFTCLTPLFGMLAAGILLGEPITATLTLAMALVGIGIYLVNRPARVGTA
jgi:drug/metabolite transporter (DMT)-like permease